MQNCQAIFNQTTFNQTGARVDRRQPVLPFEQLLKPKQVNQVALLPIGTKVKSFTINSKSCLQTKTKNLTATNLTATKLATAIKLPSFRHLAGDAIDIESEEVKLKSFHAGSPQYLWSDKILPPQSDNSSSTRTIRAARTREKFWWNWLLSAGSSILILLLPVFYQSASQASNLFEQARIYIELNSQEAMDLPDDGRAYLLDSQASPFNRAIDRAREIEASSPFYDQAQADIDRWSSTILDIAQARASKENFAGAIAAATLVPQDEFADQVLAQQAVQAVKDWRSRAKEHSRHQKYLQEAKLLIEPGQASAYNRGINTLKQIAPKTAEYQEAQNLIEQWNKEIYLIVEHRIIDGDFAQAVDAAALVSQDSAYFQLTKNLINTWSDKLATID